VGILYIHTVHSVLLYALKTEAELGTSRAECREEKRDRDSIHSIFGENHPGNRNRSSVTFVNTRKNKNHLPAVPCRRILRRRLDNT
jgi:hypothetical protein